MIFLLAALTALGGSALLLAVHRPAALVVFTGCGVFGLAVPFWDKLIELSSLAARLPLLSCGSASD